MSKARKISRFRGMIGILVIFLLMALVLFAERAGVRVGNLAKQDPYLPSDQVITPVQALAQMKKTALVITDLSRDDCADVYRQFQQILLDMKVNYDTVDLGGQNCPDRFDPYETVVVITPDMQKIGDNLLALSDWIYGGGRAMFVMTMETSSYSDFVLQKSGAVYIGDFARVDSLWFREDYALGGGQSYAIEDGFDSSLTVQLREGVEVFSRADDSTGIPLVWRNHYGNGNIVIVNYGFYEKAVRGLYSSAYTLLEDVSAYPVLNGAIMFLDDMPSPVPLGSSEYINRDYNTTISAFYNNHWFPDIQRLSEKYGFPMVGLIIENYEDVTDGSTTEQQNTMRFSYFGNMILRSGGELGYHGFNHQPLCLGNTDYRGEYDYNTWDSVEAIDSGFKELMRFSKALYPQATLSVYVPPSNILSAEGRAYIGSLYPEVRTVSGTYFKEGDSVLPYVHEYSVAEDGIVELPRVTAGSILESYTRLSALSELNFHMAFSHFIHPDDAMDPDRGADLGWDYLYNNMDGFFQWLVDSAPSIRRLDSAHFSGTIQRWAQLTVDKQWKDSKTLSIHLGNYVDEAYLQMRFNTGIPAAVTGGTLTRLTDTLYLLEAQQADITLEWS